VSAIFTRPRPISSIFTDPLLAVGVIVSPRLCRYEVSVSEYGVDPDNDRLLSCVPTASPPSINDGTYTFDKFSKAVEATRAA